MLLIGVVATTPNVASAQVFHSTASGISLGQQDANWLVSMGLTGFSNSFANAYMWASPGWISNTPSGNNPPGFSGLRYFDFRQTFDLTGFDAATAILSFQWGCDDVPAGWPVMTPYFTLNGGAAQGLGTCGNYTYGNTVNLTGFQSGVNTLDFFVQGNGQTDGLELQTQSISATPITTTPEPATLALFGTGLIAVLGVGRARKRPV